MRLGIYANCTIDTISVRGSVYQQQVGGSACYCSYTARKFRFDVCLHTRFGSDFPYQRYLYDQKIRCGGGVGGGNDDALADAPTTRFRIDVNGSERELYLQSKCDPITFADTEFDGVIISPVLDEISPETLSQIKGAASEFAFLDPQGFLRRVDSDRRVFLDRTDMDLSGITAIKASPAEMQQLVGSPGLEGMKSLQRAGARYVLCTNKTEVSMLDGDRLYSLKLPNREVYDTTGIGDIFGATFVCTMLKERDPLWGLCFAGGSVQAALETRQVGLQKVPERGATATNASYFYNTLDFRQV